MLTATAEQILIMGADQMLIDLDTTGNSPLERRDAHSETQFAAVLAQCATAPLFAPWTVASQNGRNNPAAGNAELNTHPTTSGRREGRHARR